MVVETLEAPISTTLLPQTSAADELAEVAAALRPDDPASLSRLWQLVGRDLFNVALWRGGSPEDAEDAVQEVFAALAAAPEGLRRARRPRAYLLKMAHNAAVDVCRRAARTRPLEEAPQLVAADENLDLRRDAGRVSELLLQLPPHQRITVYLRHFAELSFRDIGAVCGVSLFTAASRYRLAIKRLRQALGVQP